MDRIRHLCTIHTTRSAWVFVFWLIPAAEFLVAQTAISPTDIGELIARLDSDSYDARKQATLELIDLGAESAVPIVQAIKTGSREVIMRGIHVLGQQARSESTDTEQAARAGLQRVLQLNDRSAVTNAAKALRAVDQWRQETAIVELRRLGVDTADSVNINQAFAGVYPFSSKELFITDRWHGQPDDLRHLRWVRDLQQLYVSGKHIGDEHMVYIAKATSLSSLILERTSVTEEGLAHLTSMANLSSVDIHYAEISDEGAKHLTQIENLFRVGLKGSKISEAGEKRLIARVGNNLELHRGALLGVSASPIQPAGIGGCPVSAVTAGSAAEKCGIRPQDVIVAIDGEKIDSFPTLKAVMAKRSGGEQVEIKFLRGSDTITAKATLGEWQLFNRGGLPPQQQRLPQRPFRQVPGR